MSNDITGTIPTTTAAYVAESKAQTQNVSQDLGKTEFLKLLVTQLKNQDPMNPMDGQQFAAQLAQFSSVEQLMNMNETLAAQSQLQSMLGSGINSGVAAGLIGKTIAASGNSAEWTGTGTVPVEFTLDAAATDVKIMITDGDGKIIRTIDAGTHPKGAVNGLSWDGKADDGTTVANGTYSFSVSATDANGDQVGTTTNVNGKVDRVSFGADGIMLWVGGRSVALSDVTSVSQ